MIELAETGENMVDLQSENNSENIDKLKEVYASFERVIGLRSWLNIVSLAYHSNDMYPKIDRIFQLICENKISFAVL